MLLLVRHGQSELNAEGRLAGRLDVGLTDVGAAQAAAVADLVLARGRPERVISSPLRRAQQTAAALGLPVEIDDRWTELDYGTYDGRRIADVPVSMWDAWRRDPDYAPGGGESLLTLGRRVRQACAEIASRAGDGDTVVVSHVSPIKAAVAWALSTGDEVAWHLFLAPASLTGIAFGDRGAVVHFYNQTSHIEAALRP
ncbi:MAG TPA: histidine phosphatase family protein [Acidimicrobiales bacterium]